MSSFYWYEQSLIEIQKYSTFLFSKKVRESYYYHDFIPAKEIIRWFESQ